MNQEVNLFAVPGAEVFDHYQDNEFELAGRGQRLAASFLDNFITGCIIGVLSFILMLSADQLPLFLKNLYHSIYSQGLLSFVITQFIYLMVFITVFLLLNWKLLKKNGQTIGKKLLKIKIVRSNGQQADIKKILLYRQLPMIMVPIIPVIGAICALIDALLIFRESRQCLHDNIADTIVIKA